MDAKDFLSKLDEQKIVDAIAEAEKKTSGEIRVYVSRKKREDAMAAAGERFVKAGMTKTKLRNGIMIYIAPVTQKFAIIGDTAIHEKCGQNLWDAVVAVMAAGFKEGEFTKAIVLAVHEVGTALSKFFPPEGENPNELSNRILRD